MIKTILLTLLVYWLFQLITFFICEFLLKWDSDEELFVLGGLLFQLTAFGFWLYLNKIQPWFNDNFGYSIVYDIDKQNVYYCKRKYQYALLNQENFTHCDFEVSDFCADKWKNDREYYHDRYVPRYVKEMFPQVDKKICKQALEASNKDMGNFKKTNKGEC